SDDILQRQMLPLVFGEVVRAGLYHGGSQRRHIGMANHMIAAQQVDISRRVGEERREGAGIAMVGVLAFGIADANASAQSVKPALGGVDTGKEGASPLQAQRDPMAL